MSSGFWYKYSPECSPNEMTSNTTRGLLWLVKLPGYGEVEISGCESERAVERCRVQFSLWIIVVIFCNLIKAFNMVRTVSRSREPTLVTLGDAFTIHQEAVEAWVVVWNETVEAHGDAEV
ncbi:hypothetical protein HOY82DRAFT_614234 [Tuber indicum]|nr:hypothetical protein HOY82DRAFT_614234 [Tuber indicum]